MLSLLVTILVILIIFGLVWWVVTLIPLPPPFQQIARAVVGILLLIWIIYLLLPLTHGALTR